MTVILLVFVFPPVTFGCDIVNDASGQDIESKISRIENEKGVCRNTAPSSYNITGRGSSEMSSSDSDGSTFK